MTFIKYSFPLRGTVRSFWSLGLVKQKELSRVIGLRLQFILFLFKIPQFLLLKEAFQTT